MALLPMLRANIDGVDLVVEVCGTWIAAGTSRGEADYLIVVDGDSHRMLPAKNLLPPKAAGLR